MDRARNRRWMATCLMVAGFWTLLTLLLNGQNLAYVFLNDVHVVSWLPPIVWSTIWIIWAGTTGVVVLLGKRFPVTRDRLFRHLALHAVLAVVLGLLQAFIQALAVFFLWRLLIDTPTYPFIFWLGKTISQYQLNYLIYWMILGSWTALDYYRRYVRSREETMQLQLKAVELEASLARAQLAALKAQISPHFLFNAHHAVIGLILAGENQKAIDMLVRLSDLLRTTISARADEIPLREELDYLALYLGVQRVRFGDRLEFTSEVDPTVLDAAVPCLITQPLVENSFKHAIEKTSSSHAIGLQAFRVNGQLVIEVKDDGPGTGEEVLREGTGISNVRKRLAQLYGEKQSIQFSNRPEGGLRVRIEFPFTQVEYADQSLHRG